MDGIEQMLNNITKPTLAVWERPFDALGMMQGPYAPLLRFGFGFGLGTLVIYAIRPSFAFDASGEPLPVGIAKFPWWGVSLAVAATFSLLI